VSRPINSKGIDLVKQFEGLRTTAYTCPAGIWTIGYGHTGGVSKGQTVTAVEAEDLLQNDLAKAGDQVQQMVRVSLHDNQYAALCSFVFNAGAASLKASTLLKRLNGGDYDGVPSELAKWVKATDPKTGAKITLAGLVRRRSAEGQLWLEGGDPAAFSASADMPQEVHADGA
jgi:lysozyme